MALYSISAVDRDGNKFTKLLDFSSELEIYDYLDAIGADIIDIKKRPSFFKYADPKILFSSIRPQETIEILENLQIIIRSGLPANTALFDLAADSDNPAAASMLSDIAFRIQTGNTLSQAVEKYRRIFGDTAVSLIRIGEETGSLDITLKDAADHLKKIQDLKSKAKSALIYPVMSFFGLFAAMLFWLIVVMPEIIDAFTSFDMVLPAATRFIQWLSLFLQDNILFILGGMALFIAAVIVGRRKSPRFHYLSDKFFLKIPVIGLLQANFNLAFFSEYIRLMIAAGIPLYQALTIIEGAMSNMVFKKAVNSTREGIAAGKSFSDCLKNEGIFPSLVVRMLGVGEQTGRIEEQLGYIAQYYYTKVDYLSQNIAKFIEPVIIIFVGVFMLVIMVGLLGPVYDLISNISTTSNR